MGERLLAVVCVGKLFGLRVMADSDSSLMISVPANSGRGQVVHLPVLSGDMVDEGDCLATVKTDVDYFTLRAPTAGRVLTLVKTGQDVIADEPLLILQTEESLIADQLATAKLDPEKRDLVAPAKPVTDAPSVPGQAEADARRAAVQSAQDRAQGRDAPRRYAPAKRSEPVVAGGVAVLPSRGGALDTSLRIVLSLILYIAAAFLLLPDLATEAMTAEGSQKSILFTAFALAAGALWVIVGLRGSQIASRAVGVVSALLVLVSGLMIYGGLGTVPTQPAAISATAVTTGSPAEATGVQPAAEEAPTEIFRRSTAPVYPGEAWVRRLGRGPNLHGLVGEMQRHQAATHSRIVRPQMPIYALSSRLALPRDLPDTSENRTAAALAKPAHLDLPRLSSAAVRDFNLKPASLASLESQPQIAHAPVPMVTRDAAPYRPLQTLNLRHTNGSAGPVLSSHPLSRVTHTN